MNLIVFKHKLRNHKQIQLWYLHSVFYQVSIYCLVRLISQFIKIVFFLHHLAKVFVDALAERAILGFHLRIRGQTFCNILRYTHGYQRPTVLVH